MSSCPPDLVQKTKDVGCKGLPGLEPRSAQLGSLPIPQAHRQRTHVARKVFFLTILSKRFRAFASLNRQCLASLSSGKNKHPRPQARAINNRSSTCAPWIRDACAITSCNAFALAYGHFSTPTNPQNAPETRRATYAYPAANMAGALKQIFWWSDRGCQDLHPGRHS